MPFKTRRMIFSWVAVLAILLNAMMPTLAQALVADKGEGSAWVEVCSAQGISRVSAGTDAGLSTQEAQDAPGPAQAAKCAYCLVHADSFALPPAMPEAPRLLQPVTGHLLPIAQRPMQSRALWALPSVRAPPRG